jgi:probable poly-beta-1,6-N-acetyl-D-glucosamine export protein
MNDVKQKHIEEFDILRAIAIISVVLIHITSQPIGQLSEDSILQNIFLAVNRLLQFAVPLFILISSVVAAYSLRNISKVNWNEFFSKKINRIVIPYITWTFIYVVYNIIRHNEYLLKLTNIKSLISIFLLGKSNPHLYFMIVLIQLYLFIPFILAFVKKIPDKAPGVLLIAGSIQIAVYWFNRIVISDFYRSSATLFITYLFMILTGVWLGFHYENRHVLWKRYRSSLFTVCILSSAYYIYLSFRIQDGSKISTFLYQMDWYIFVSSISALLWKFSCYLNNGNSSIKLLLKRIGCLSFGIYLVHPLILQILVFCFRLAETSNIYVYLIFLLVIFIATITFSISITLFLQKYKRLSWMIGEKKRTDN